MEITLEWEGISGIIKIIALFTMVFIFGFIIGKKMKK